MREWIPVSTSPKGRLALRALQEFGDRPFTDVTVGEIAAGAGVTTGALYHHFDGKLGLYDVVRNEAERRLLDRMAGAASARANDSASAALTGALLVGFDFATGQGFVRLLGEAHPSRERDPVAALLDDIAHHEGIPIGAVLAAGWRAALMAVATGTPVPRARLALNLLRVDDATGVAADDVVDEASADHD